METTKRWLELPISQRWPKLKKRAQRETNPEKLILLLEEIEDLLRCALLPSTGRGAPQPTRIRP